MAQIIIIHDITWIMNFGELIAENIRCSGNDLTWKGALTTLRCEFQYLSTNEHARIHWFYVRNGVTHLAEGNRSYIRTPGRTTLLVERTASRAMDGRVYTCQASVDDFALRCTRTLTVRTSTCFTPKLDTIMILFVMLQPILWFCWHESDVGIIHNWLKWRSPLALVDI